VIDFIKGNFYGQFTIKNDYAGFNRFNLLSRMENFDTAPAFEIYTRHGERVGFKRKGRIVIKVSHFSFAYEHHVQSHNQVHPNNKITASLMQYLKQLKEDGILTHEVGRITSRDFVFGRDRDGNPITPNCYAFKVDPDAPDDWSDVAEMKVIPPADFPDESGTGKAALAEDDDPIGGGAL
jgi:phosphoribosylaminoimidazole-succinocarboxamide synthase